MGGYGYPLDGGFPPGNWESRVDKNFVRTPGVHRESLTKQDMASINFTKPESGPRLGIFSSLNVDDVVMPDGRPNLTQVHVTLHLGAASFTHRPAPHVTLPFTGRQAETSWRYPTFANNIIF